MTAAGFATRGEFAAAVLHTARAACAGVLRAASARLAAAGVSRKKAGARSDGGVARTATLSETPRGSVFARAGSSPGGGDVADIADESQFPSLCGARRRLDDAGRANGYGSLAPAPPAPREKADEASSTLNPRPTSAKPPKRIQPTSTKLSLDAAGPGPPIAGPRGPGPPAAPTPGGPAVGIIGRGGPPGGAPPAPGKPASRMASSFAGPEKAIASRAGWEETGSDR